MCANRTLRSFVMIRPFCLRVFAFPFGAGFSQSLPNQSSDHILASLQHIPQITPFLACTHYHTNLTFVKEKSEKNSEIQTIFGLFFLQIAQLSFPNFFPFFSKKPPSYFSKITHKTHWSDFYGHSVCFLNNFIKFPLSFTSLQKYIKIIQMG